MKVCRGISQPSVPKIFISSFVKLGVVGHSAGSIGEALGFDGKARVSDAMARSKTFLQRTR